MPILVHCPNPGCARVHRVNDRCAGQRGKCPQCAHWMYVPPESPAVALSPPEDAPTFGGMGAACLYLGMACLAVLAITPLLPQPSFKATGDFAAALSTIQTAGFGSVRAGYVTALPLLAGLLPLGALLAGAISRRPGFFSISLTYLSVACASLFAFMAMLHLRVETDNASRLEKSVQLSRETGKQGEASVSPGLCLQAGVGGASAAAGLFLLAAFALHRRWWSRVLAVLILGFPLVLGTLWIFKDHLGVGS